MKTSFWTKLFDLISPRQCAVCGCRLAAGESVLCAPCALHMPYTDFHLSPTDNAMARLFWGHFPIERAGALYYYQQKSDASQLIYDMKYHGMADACRAVGRSLAERFMPCRFFDGIDAIVPIPITNKRRWQRGYNQSELIAQGIHDVCGLPIYNKVVKRRHFTRSQTSLGLQERRKNVEGAFQLVDSQAVSHKHVLIVDDIVTTGSTIIACATEMLKASDIKFSAMTVGFTKS